MFNTELATCKNYKNRCFKLKKYISAKFMSSVMVTGKLLVGAGQRKFYFGQCPVSGAILRTVKDVLYQSSQDHITIFINLKIF